MSRKRSQPTLRTLAEMTGLSLSTVSLALRDESKLKATTRQKVLQAAEEIGYVPDKSGVRLRTGRSNTIALILDGREDSVGFSRKLIHGISDEAKKRHITLNVYPQFDQAASEQTISSLVTSNLIDGFILTHTSPQDGRAKMLLEMGVPFVTHGRTELYTPHPYHDFHSENFVEVALRKLVERGSSNILAVLSNNQTFNHLTIKRRFLSLIEELEISGSVYEDERANSDHISGLREFGANLALNLDGIDGILCDQELVAICLASGLRDGGAVIGETVNIISKQTSDLLPELFPEVLRIKEGIYDAGTELARLLFACMNGEKIENLQTLSTPKVG